jgi:putative membrane protein
MHHSMGTSAAQSAYFSPRPLAWTAVFCTVLLWSVINPKGYYIWFLEALPALLGFAVLIATRRRFPLTPVAYWLVLIHCIILMVGAHYTYAEVPLFDWIRDELGQSRNDYDKLGHFAQGFVPALLARELLIRLQVVRGRAWLNFLVVCFCLAVSAFYELIEWWVALLSEQAADAFLGTQGYVWDTQSDMGLALLGAILALLVLAPLHDRQLGRLRRDGPA